MDTQNAACLVILDQQAVAMLQRSYVHMHLRQAPFISHAIKAVGDTHPGSDHG